MLRLPNREALVEEILAALMEPSGITIRSLMDGQYGRLPEGGGIYLIGFELDRFEGGPLAEVRNWTSHQAAFYVGMTDSFQRRFGEHAMKIAAITEESKDGRAGAAVDLDSFFITCVPVEEEDQLIFETLAIQEIHPLANGRFNGDFRTDPDHAWTLVGLCAVDKIPDEIAQAARESEEPPFLRRYDGMGDRLSARLEG